MDRMTKVGHFIPIRYKPNNEILPRLYMDHIVRLYGIPLSIMSDRDPSFTSHFEKSMDQALETRLNFSTTYYPQTNGQTKRTILMLEEVLRTCVNEFERSWTRLLPLVKFAFNNSYHSSLGTAPYEALYGSKCRIFLC